ncbi:hypothetical protein EU244_025225 [Rhodococcus qingshengii]|uniref:hypothetical protein n=1 Tax=Rhodococcus qingshengii TaxID=334542 RepID=UPI0010A646AD|nr:hypothetical protein [Rhodococcus qingshengii]THJ70692.1 hypothetical protein EU244_15245 [Rhodococcus qingshengii]
MHQMCTTRVREEWVVGLLTKFGTLTRLAEKLDVDVSTASRWMDGHAQASPRCIGTVLIKLDVDFDTAFVATMEEAEHRRARIVKRPTGKRIAQMDRVVA